MKNYATHAINLKIFKIYSNSTWYISIFFTKWFQKNLSLSSLTQELKESFTDSRVMIIFIVENENVKSIPLTPLISELKEVFQFCLIYWYIFHKMDWEKFITFITYLNSQKSIIPLQQHDWYYIPLNSPIQAF